MPVARYNIGQYVEDCFAKIGMPLVNDEDKKTYENLIKSSIGTNPRAMKRLFNSFQLLTMVVGDKLKVADDPKRTEKNKQLLFASLCLQYCNENIYNFIVRNCDDLTLEQYNAIENGKYSELLENSNMGELDGLEEDDLNAAGPFMVLFSKAMDTDGSNGIDNKEFEMFKEVISFSAITAASDTEGEKEKKRKAPEVISIDKIKFLRKGNSIDDLIKFMETIEESMGEKRVSPSILQYKSGFNVRYTFNNRFYIDVVERTGGFAVQYLAPADVFDNLIGPMSDIKEKRNICLRTYGNLKYLMFTVQHNVDDDYADLRTATCEYAKLITE